MNEHANALATQMLSHYSEPESWPSNQTLVATFHPFVLGEDGEIIPDSLDLHSAVRSPLPPSMLIPMWEPLPGASWVAVFAKHTHESGEVISAVYVAGFHQRAAQAERNGDIRVEEDFDTRSFVADLTNTLAAKVEEAQARGN